MSCKPIAVYYECDFCNEGRTADVFNDTSGYTTHWVGNMYKLHACPKCQENVTKVLDKLKKLTDHPVCEHCRRAYD